MNMSIQLLGVFLLLQFATNGFAKCERIPKCNQPINIYQHLQCTPKFEKETFKGTGCPSSFDCSQIKPQTEKCYYRGKYYNVGEEIDEGETVSSCLFGCECSDELTFECAIADCFFPEVEEGCYLTYGFNQCCPYKKCQNNDTTICQDNGKGYRVYEGQTFTNPEDKCSTCMCEHGWTGNLRDLQCRRLPCYEEIAASDRIANYCAPVYNNLDDCCPNEYICPDAELDDFKRKREDTASLSDSSDSHEKKAACRYGESEYAIGTKFTRQDASWYSYDCECAIPPYFTCLKSSLK